MKYLRGFDIAVERAVGLPFGRAVIPRNARSVRCGWPLTAYSRPAVVDGVIVIPVVAIQVEGDANLMLVVGALGAEASALGPRQGRQQHGCKDRNDSDDDEQFNQREGAERFMCRTVASHNQSVFQPKTISVVQVLAVVAAKEEQAVASPDGSNQPRTGCAVCRNGRPGVTRRVVTRPSAEVTP